MGITLENVLCHVLLEVIDTVRNARFGGSRAGGLLDYARVWEHEIWRDLALVSFPCRMPRGWGVRRSPSEGTQARPPAERSRDRVGLRSRDPVSRNS
jgi:hypothetical protein